MASTSVPHLLHFCKMLINSTPSLLAPNIAHNFGPKLKLRHAKLSHHIPQTLHFHKGFFNCNGSRRTPHPHTAVARGPDHPESLGPREEHGALETVLRLYEALKHKNVHELSDIIAEECSCISNFVSAFQPFLGKKQVMGFFSSLMKYMGNNIEFVVQQTLDEGMVVGVSWKLEWNKVHKVPIHLGKGFSFYTCHVYQGKVRIRNVEMFLEPILHMEPLRLKWMSLVMAAMDKLNPHSVLKNRATKAIILFFLLFLAAVVCLLK